MPLYEYVCMACESRFERLVSLSGPTPVCPECGEARARKQLSVFAAASGGTSGSGSPSATPGGGGGCCGGACGCS